MKYLILVLTILQFTFSSYGQGTVITRDLKTMNRVLLSKLELKALMACEKGDLKKLTKLIEANKIDLDYTIQNKPILIILPKNGRHKLVEYSLSKGANHKGINHKGITSLLAASSFKYDNIVDLLKKYGADGAIGHSPGDFLCVGYEKLKTNMSYSDVQHIVGSEFSIYGISDNGTNILNFGRDHSFIFENGKLSSWPCM